MIQVGLWSAFCTCAKLSTDACPTIHNHNILQYTLWKHQNCVCCAEWQLLCQACIIITFVAVHLQKGEAVAKHGLHGEAAPCGLCGCPIGSCISSAHRTISSTCPLAFPFKPTITRRCAPCTFHCLVLCNPMGCKYKDPFGTLLFGNASNTTYLTSSSSFDGEKVVFEEKKSDPKGKGTGECLQVTGSLLVHGHCKKQCMCKISRPKVPRHGTFVGLC